MENFTGFSDRNQKGIFIPEPFFRFLLPEIDDLDELKVTLYVFWRLFFVEGNFQYVLLSDILNDEHLLAGSAKLSGKPVEKINSALEKAINRGTFLSAELKQENTSEIFYFLNDPRGKAAVEAIQKGNWKYSRESKTYQINLPLETRNIFQLYEENIGPITPILADALGEIEDTYPAFWIEEAFQIAVKNNKRSLKYIEAILKRWHEGGKNGRRVQADFEKSGKEYIDGEYSDFIEH
jgi:DnaD/phage-associated family protein